MANRDQILLSMCVVWSSSVAMPQLARAEDGAHWRAKAAAAIAIHNSARTIVPIVPVNTPADASRKPIVTMYSATWCAPCQRAKAELSGSTLPFELRFQDVSQGGQPEWCDALPAFAWEVRGQTRYVLGYAGARQLVSSWEQTFRSANQVR